MNSKQLKKCYEVAAYSRKSRVRKKAMRRIIDTVKSPADYFFLFRRMAEFKIFKPDLWQFFTGFLDRQRRISRQQRIAKMTK